jgi:hypothetical protein
MQNKNAAGEWVDSPEVFPLHMPTQLTTVGIHSTRRLIVEEGRRVRSRVKSVSAVADRAIIAGQQCERSYDALNPVWISLTKVRLGARGEQGAASASTRDPSTATSVVPSSGN